MRSILLAGMLLSQAAMANDCNVHFAGHVQLSKQLLTVELPDHHKAHIRHNYLDIDGKTVTLNPQQQQWLNDYHQGFLKAAPQAADIAIKAVDLASQGVNMAFTELLGADSDVVADLDKDFKSIRGDMKAHFYADDGSIQFDSTGFDDDGGVIDNEFGQELKDKVERAVKRSMGSVMIALGKQMLLSGGDTDAFEKKMDNFGDSIEQRMDSRSAELEKQADELCYAITDIDHAEAKLANGVPELAGLNVVEVQYHSHDDLK